MKKITILFICFFVLLIIPSLATCEEEILKPPENLKSWHGKTITFESYELDMTGIWDCPILNTSIQYENGRSRVSLYVSTVYYGKYKIKQINYDISKEGNIVGWNLEYFKPTSTFFGRATLTDSAKIINVSVK